MASNMRISGLASGMDIDDMVSRLMKAHRVPLDKLEQKKQVLEWQRDDYRTMNAKIMELRNEAFNMQLSSKYTARKSTSSAENLVTASATPTATEGVYTLEVTALAKAAALNSGAVGAASGLNSTLSSLGLTGGYGTLTIGGEKGSATINVSHTETIDELVKDINNQSNQTGVKVSYDSSLDRFFFVSTKTGALAKVNLTSENASLINDVFNVTGTSDTIKRQTVTGTKVFADGGSTVIDNTITSAAPQTLRINYDNKDYDYQITADTTVGSLIKTINGSDLGKKGVSAYLDSSGKLAFNNPNEAKGITITDHTSDSKDMLDKLGLTAPTTVSNISTVSASASGANAEVKFNNVAATYDTNTFQINGINFTAKDLTTSAVTINVTQDVDTVFESIKTFVTKYNEMVDLVNKELSEKRYRDFQPLTAEQREAMEEKDIERWEEKAKSGMLKGDLLLQSAANSLRSALNRTVQGLPSGDMKVLADIGITSGSWSENGKLYIDETKLRKAIAENPDQVAALFSTNDGVKGAQNTDGLAVRLYQEADAIMEKITKKAGKEFSVNNSFTLGKNLDDLEDEMEEWAVRLDSLQTRYYKQFTAMENALNKMNAQSSYLMQQFGGAG